MTFLILTYLGRKREWAITRLFGYPVVELWRECTWLRVKHPGWCNECGVTHSPLIFGFIAKVLFERWNIVWKSIRGSYFWMFTVWKALSCEQEEINIISIKGAIHAGVFLVFILKSQSTHVFVGCVWICFSKWSVWNSWLSGGSVVVAVVVGTVCGWMGGVCVLQRTVMAILWWEPKLKFQFSQALLKTIQNNKVCCWFCKL